MCGAVEPAVRQSIQEEVKVVKVVVVVEEEEDKSAEKTASEVAAEGEGARCRGAAVRRGPPCKLLVGSKGPKIPQKRRFPT